MSESTLWALDDLMRSLQAERLAEAARERLASSARPPSRSLRAVLADGLRALARSIDQDDIPAVRQPDRPFARA